jgi:beta-lactam-binding protein with PASTA domain
VFRLLSSPGAAPASSAQVTVPKLVGLSFEAAQSAAAAQGLTVTRAAFASSSETQDTVLQQDPPAGATVAAGTTISLTLSRGSDTAVVPNLIGQTEQQAVNLLFAAGLQAGTRTEDFDPSIPVGSVIAQDPGAGVVVTKGLAVNYVVSKGPEPTPSPTPSPTPTPTPTPTPEPTPAPIPVGDYRCVPLPLAEAQILSDGFKVGTINGSKQPDWIVVAQDPAAGTTAPPGSKIDLTDVDPSAAPTPCP